MTLLAHDVTGDGSPVLLLHSTACDRRMWDPQIPALTATGHRVIRCDLRGYGESAVPDESWSDAQDVVDLLDHYGVARTALVGASGGGRVALEVAARWPGRITSLALLCTALAGHEPSPVLAAFGAEEDALLEAGDAAAATELNVALWLGPDATDDVRDRVRQMQRHSFDVQLAARQDVGPVRAEIDLATVTATALVVSGTYDVPDFREIAATVASALKAEHVELETGHLPSLEAPVDVNTLLTVFLQVL
ncbi:alpha/beta fold hydrolase [Winogradskya humida]|uniref:Alpha/beta hydrolase n=1 Tax=Winogradskya humida TaxID=113566 RepID=A0ABQ3ZKB5_9ACTN|nr:alpha/beta hydrolase [Actinoplanes humidus]GIE18944.1 alpha/beta hydrolase [Actinoplanes humidus]